jgi:hypothetical protein
MPYRNCERSNGSFAALPMLELAFSVLGLTDEAYTFTAPVSSLCILTYVVAGPNA